MKKMLAAAALTVAGIAIAPNAHADPNAELGYLSSLNAFGIVVYNVPDALSTGYGVCNRIDAGATGLDEAKNLFVHSSWSAVPDMETAADIVIASVVNLCPWNWHPVSAA